MTKRAFLISLLGIFVTVAGLGLLFKIFFLDNHGVAAIQVQSFPKADVYLNGHNLGSTPFKSESQAPGEYDLKLVANLDNKQLVWSSKVKLTADTITFINRELADQEDQNAGEILTLEKLANDQQAEIAIVSDPNGAIVKVDGNNVGTTPTSVSNATATDHEITLSFPDYRDRSIRGRAVAGYRLNISAQMAKNAPENTTTTISPPPTATPSAAPTATTTPDKPYVTIKSTPTGWLRVRSGPTTSASESGRVNPGESYPLLDEQTGWVQIKVSETLTGWVSDSYVTKYK